jgi:hypothetical protein
LNHVFERLDIGELHVQVKEIGFVGLWTAITARLLHDDASKVMRKRINSTGTNAPLG